MARVIPPPVTLGVRAPMRIQGQPFGTVNASAGGRAPVTPSILSKGPAQTLEQFTSLNGIPENVARALNTLQGNIEKALSQAKESPFADGNLIEKCPLTNGSAFGAAPYNVIQHGLGKPFRGAFILATYQGAVNGWAVIPNSTSALDASQITLWTALSPFGNTTADIWVYA